MLGLFWCGFPVVSSQGGRWLQWLQGLRILFGTCLAEDVQHHDCGTLYVLTVHAHYVSNMVLNISTESCYRMNSMWDDRCHAILPPQADKASLLRMLEDFQADTNKSASSATAASSPPPPSSSTTLSDSGSGGLNSEQQDMADGMLPQPPATTSMSSEQQDALSEGMREVRVVAGVFGGVQLLLENAGAGAGAAEGTPWCV